MNTPKTNIESTARELAERELAERESTERTQSTERIELIERIELAERESAERELALGIESTERNELEERTQLAMRIEAAERELAKCTEPAERESALGTQLALRIELALRANNYARGRILHGCTQVENNELPIEYFDALYKAIYDIESLADLTKDEEEIAETLRSLMDKFSSDPVNLLNDLNYDFEKTIILTNKYSLGNCQELANQALDYLLSSDLDIEVEVFSFDGPKADHSFLVIGRDPNSNPNDINSWGRNAVICDPWANKVYQATEEEYKQNLKSSYREYKVLQNNKIKITANRVTDYNPDKHTLESILSLSELKKGRMLNTLVENYHKELNFLDGKINNYRNRLEKRMSILKNEYGTDDEKFKVINEKLSDIDHIVSHIQFLKDDVKNIKTDIGFRQFHLELRRNIYQLFDSITKILQLSDNEKTIVSTHRKPDSLKSKARMFFNIPTDTQSVLDKANKTILSDLTKKMLKK